VTSHLLGVSEIAKLLGVSRARVVQIVSSYSDFPPAEVELASGRVWRRPEIEEWVRKHPDRKPGRPAG
jgi:predicted DNA-binding transcriptional regulator AlpA